MRSTFGDSPEFQRLLEGDPCVDLARIALEIARDVYPELDPEEPLGRIEGLAARVRDRCAASAKPRSILGQISWVLFVEEKFRGNGDEYYDPRNSYLNEVLDRKLGIPISLAVLYRAVAERAGLKLDGVNLPCHFMLRTGRDAATILIDPFHEGALLDRLECERKIEQLAGQRIELSENQLAPCGLDEVVSRMLRNLKMIYLQNHDLATAIPVQRRLAALNSGNPLEHRDLGLLYFQLDRPAEALDPLQAYLDALPEADDVATIRSYLGAAQREVARWN